MARYVEERQQFGKPLSAFQAIQWMLADSSAECDAIEILLQQARRAPSDKSEALKAARFAARSAITIADRAIQAHGGYGFTLEYEAERYWRAAHYIEKAMLPCSSLQNEIIAEQTVSI